MGRTFKDRRKFDRKHDKNEGIKEMKREPRKRHREDLDENFDPYDVYDDQDYED
jgi:hypothetical protein